MTPEEETVHRRRNCHAFGEEHHTLTPGQLTHRTDDGEETVDGGVPLFVALERFEPRRHVRCHLCQLRVGAGRALARASR